MCPPYFLFDGSVVQLVRMPACHAGGRGFEPHPSRQHASVAQSVEQGTENPRVGGSIPPGGTIDQIKLNICGSGSVVERHLAKVNVASSNLVFRSKNKSTQFECFYFCTFIFSLFSIHSSQKTKSIFRLKNII